MTAKRPQVPRASGEVIHYSARDLQVQAVEHDHRRRTHMRAVGTGTHPEGRYLEGQVFDLPEVQPGASDTAGAPDIEAVHPDYRSIIENGWAELVDPVNDPGRTDSQIAHSMVRGDTLAHPLDADKADEIGPERALAIVHTDDPEATEVPDPHEDRGSNVGRGGFQHGVSPRGASPGAADDLEDGEQVARTQANGGDDGEGGGNAARRTTRPSQRSSRSSKASSKGGGGKATGTADGGEGADSGGGTA